MPNQHSTFRLYILYIVYIIYRISRIPSLFLLYNRSEVSAEHRKHVYYVLHLYDEIDLVYKGQPIFWTISFKYLGSFISSHELLSCLGDCLITNAGKAGGAVRSACRSAVAVPVSRLVYLHKSLVSPIALCSIVLLGFLSLNKLVSGTQRSRLSGGFS